MLISPLCSPASLLPSCDWLYLCGLFTSSSSFPPPIGGEQNRNMANGFACFSSVRHAESSLPGSLGLVISTVTSDSKQFGVAEWPKA